MRPRRTLLAIFVALAVVGLSSAKSSAEIKQIRSIEGITEYELDNGLKVLLFPDPSKPTVTVNLTVFVGSRHEGYGEAGMAHLLEHMLFKGTPTHPEIPKVLQGRGARFNGTTWLDRTNYYETLPANDDNLEFAIRLEADRMVNSYVKGEDLASEMTVVRSEFERGENSPARVLSQRMMAVAFEWHNYGKSTIGNRADIERVPVEKLRVFYKRFYQPDNAMLVVAGQFDHDKALKFIGEYFGKLPRPERVLDTTYTEEPAQDGERYVTLRRVGDVAVAGTVYHIPAGPHPDFPPIDVMSSILTEAPSGRLYKALVETKKASSIVGGPYALHDPGVVTFRAEVTQGNDADVVLDTMLDVVETLGEKGVTEEEVDRAKQQLLKQIELAAADSSQIAVDLSEWAAQGDWRLYFLYRDRIEQVTAADVQRVAKEYLRRSNRTAGVFVPLETPDRATIPATPKLAEMIGDYQGREAIAAGEAFDVDPQSIETRTTRFTLPGGLKVAFLNKKTRGESVNARLTLRYGNIQNLRGLATAADVLPALMKRGTEDLDRQQIEDELDKYRARLGASGSLGSATFTIEAKRSNLAPVLHLLKQILREPSLPEKELELIKQAQITGLEQALSDPTQIAVSTVRRTVSPFEPSDPRYIPSNEESIERVKSLGIQKIRQLYQEYLGATAGELTIVGDFDPEDTKRIAAEILSDWQPAQSYARIEYPGDMGVKGSYQQILTPDKANATYFAAMTFPVRDAHPDFPALVMGNFILGGGSLSSRLGNRVRQKDGLSYTIGSNLSGSAVDDRSYFYIFAISNPANTPKVKAAIREEIERLLKEGVTAEELQAAKEGYLQRRSVSRTDDATLAATLEETSYADRSMKFEADFEEKINAVTQEQVMATLKKYLNPDQLVIVAAGDFDQKSEPEPASDKPAETKSTN